MPLCEPEIPSRSLWVQPCLEFCIVSKEKGDNARGLANERRGSTSSLISSVVSRCLWAPVLFCPTYVGPFFSPPCSFENKKRAAKGKQLRKKKTHLISPRVLQLCGYIFFLSELSDDILRINKKLICSHIFLPVDYRYLLITESDEICSRFV